MDIVPKVFFSPPDEFYTHTSHTFVNFSTAMIMKVNALQQAFDLLWKTGQHAGNAPGYSDLRQSKKTR